MADKKAAPGANRTAASKQPIPNFANYSPLDNLLSHLDKVKQTGPGRCVAQCPAHVDKSPSLTIRETDDGRVLIHCFAGCSVHEIVHTIRLNSPTCSLATPSTIAVLSATRFPRPMY